MLAEKAISSLRNPEYPGSLPTELLCLGQIPKENIL
jgi:hypothetical protein